MTDHAAEQEMELEALEAILMDELQRMSLLISCLLKHGPVYAFLIPALH